MIAELIRNIEEKTEVRQNLSRLRQESREEPAKSELQAALKGREEMLTELLASEDAKTRKNAVLLMGEVGTAVYLKPIYEAYEKEEQLFVKSAYLTALRAFDYRAYLPALKKRMDLLSKMTPAVEEKKHITEEMRELSELIVTMEGVEKHEFTGYRKSSELILLANRRQMEVTERQITEDAAQHFGAGIKVQTKRLDRLLPIRTYQELLFIIPKMNSCEQDAVLAAQKIAQSDLLQFLLERHEGGIPFYFRVEVKSKMPLDKKSIFVKKLTAEIEKTTKRAFINSPSNYEFEIRLIENSEKKFNMLVKLLTIPDERFSYRKVSIAASIKPVNAALLVELAKDYMKVDAQVLDPFCGVGTMLIERQKVVKGNTAYGIDILEDAIVKARINTEEAGQIIHYINKDFFDFEHEYLFDEIFTNMPFAFAHKTEEEIQELYVHFFDSAKIHLKQDSTVIMYTHNADLVRRLAPGRGYTIQKQFEIMTREGTYLIILTPSFT